MNVIPFDSKKEFTRFEYQYILMMAVQAKRQMIAMKEDQTGYKDPNIEGYIKTLDQIILKTKRGMDFIDKKKESSEDSL